MAPCIYYSFGVQNSDPQKNKTTVNSAWASLLENNAPVKTSLSTSGNPTAMPAEVVTAPSTVAERIGQETAEPAVLTVTGLNTLIKKNIENEFPTIWLQGEISNFKPHTSGHYYFSLKDNKSQISAVMFKGFNSKLKFRPESGMEVIVRGRVTVYEPRGTYQIFCENMEPVGAGALQQAYEQLKAQLQKEGLFNPELKKKWPAFPQHIGIVTSPTGAAIQDMLNVLTRRYRAAQITVIPARVQGEGAAAEIARGIQLANRVKDIDVLIVGRGGGSIEDLWPFNEEIVARAIFASKIPIISAVGHEIDFTIADFVADHRAPTPSAAAEIVAQSVTETTERLRRQQRQLSHLMRQKLSEVSKYLINIQARLVDPKRRLEDLSLRCDELSHRLNLAMQQKLRERKMRVQLLRTRMPSPKDMVSAARDVLKRLQHQLVLQQKAMLSRARESVEQQMTLLDSLSPLKVLQRGYSVVFKNEKVIRSFKEVQPQDRLRVQLADGVLDVEVQNGSKP
ncbi:MAG: exodeoxyribonuclease VII large subunit [Bdellovibrionales bacterium]|nr:exodeoxyribonuclease VII large subunit [Bdellovibrionales bacterium]